MTYVTQGSGSNYKKSRFLNPIALQAMALLKKSPFSNIVLCRRFLRLGSPAILSCGKLEFDNPPCVT